MPGARRRAAFPSIVLACLPLLVTLLPVTQSGAHAAAAEPAVLQTVGAALSPVAPGSFAVAELTLANHGGGPTGTPVELTVTTPAEATFQSFTDDDQSWNCAAPAAATTCVLVHPGTETPRALAAGEVVSGRATVVVSPTAPVGPSTLDAAATAPGDGAEPDLTDASTSVTFDPMPADQHLAIEVDSDFVGILVAGANDTSVTRIRNLGPASLGGAPTVLRAPLPPGAVLVEHSGQGWSCAQEPVLICSWTGNAAAPGESLPALTLTAAAPGELTGPEDPLAWERTVTAPATTGGDPTVDTTPLTAVVIEAPIPDVGVSVLSANPQVLEAPGTVEVALLVAGTNLIDSSNEVALTATLPTGFSFASVASEQAWECRPQAAAVQCTLPADFHDQSSSRLDLSLQVAQDAPAGAASVAFAVAVGGEEDDALEDNTDTVTVRVDAPPPAGLSLRRWAYDDGIPVESDGSPLRAAPGETVVLGLDALNDGSSSIPAGTELELFGTLPAGTAVTATGAPWECRAATTDQDSAETRNVAKTKGSTKAKGPTKTKGPKGPDGGADPVAEGVLRCGLSLGEAVPIDGALPRLRVELGIAEDQAAGEVVVPISLEPVDAGQAHLSSAIDVPVLVEEVVEEEPEVGLGLDVTVVKAPRVGGAPGELRVEVTNNGTDPVRGTVVEVDLPDGLSVAKGGAPGCRTKNGRSGVDLVCRTSAKVAGGESFRAFVIAVVAGEAKPRRPWWHQKKRGGWGSGSAAPTGGPVHVTAASRGVPDDAETTVDLKVLPALVAVAEASPTLVANQPFGGAQPSVLLDGRASVAVQATHRWRQEPRGAEPTVVFDGAGSDAGSNAGSVAAATARFTVPVVEETTVLHFVLEISDGTSTETDAVAVTVEPVPVAGPGEDSGWKDQEEPVQTTSARWWTEGSPQRTTAFAADEAETAWWTWSNPPSVRYYFESGPVIHSRLTLLDNGDFSFSGAGDPPSTEEVSHAWLLCNLDGTGEPDLTDCDVIGTGDSVVPRQAGRAAVLRMTVRGQRLDETLETVEDFVLGVVGTDGGPPYNYVPPTISGPPEVGTELSIEPGEWTIEYQFENEWQRCTSAAGDGCTAVGSGPTYLVSTEDLGSYLRLEQTSHAVGRDDPTSVTTETVGPVTVAALSVSTDLDGGTASLPNDTDLEVFASSTGGAGEITFVWTQTAGPAVLDGPSTGATLQITTPATGTAELGFTVEATDGDGTVASTSIAVTYGLVDVPGTFCRLHDDARAAGSGPVTFTLGTGIVLGFSDAVITPGDCSATSTLELTGATLDLYDWLRVRDLVVQVDSEGISFTEGTLEARGDTQLSGIEFSLVGDGLYLGFDGDSNELTVSGEVMADTVPFLDLAEGWEAATLLGFSSAGGEQEMTLAGVAWDAQGAAAPETGAGLPDPPEEVPQLAISGSVSSDRSFDLALAASDLVEIQGAAVDLEGTIARDAAGAYAMTVAGSLNEPVALGRGLELSSAELAWDGERFTGDGTLSVAVNGSTLEVALALDFTDSRSFAASLSLAAGADGSWTPVPGLTLTDAAVTGSIERDGETTAVLLEIGAQQIDLGAALTLEEPRFVLDATCAATCETQLAVSGAAVIGIGTPATTVALEGTLDLGTGDFAVAAGIGALRPVDGLVVEDLTLTVASNGESPIAAGLAGTANLLGSAARVVIELSEDGFVVVATLDSFVPADGAPRFDGVQVVYASFDTEVVRAGQVIEVAADTVQLIATTTAPTWLTARIGNLGVATVAGVVDLDDGAFDVEIGFALAAPRELVELGGVSLQLRDVTFRVTADGGFITSQLTSNAVVGLPSHDASGARQSVPATFGATYSPTSGLSGFVTIADDWADAFGIPDLTVSDFSLGVHLGATSGLVLGGSVTLPSAWAQGIGLVPGTPVRLDAMIAGPASCFGLEIGSDEATEPVIDLGNAGAVTATYLDIVIAPWGCAIGAQELDPGVSLVFDGEVLGAAVEVAARMRPAPFELEASLEIGELEVEGFRLRGARAEVEIGPSVRSVSLEADATVFGADAQVRGAFAQTPGGTEVELVGTFAPPEVGGFDLGSLEVAFALEQTPGEVSMEAGATAVVNLLGAEQRAEFEFAVHNGVIDGASGSFEVTIPMDRLLLEGTAAMVFEPGVFPTVTLDGSLSADGHELSSLVGALTPGGLEVEATLGTPIGATEAPRLAGAIAWASDGSSQLRIKDQGGNEVVAQPGDFRFAATGVGFRAQGFHLAADVAIGFVRGVAWAELAASLNMGSRVAVSGSFASNGDFSLQGQAALSLNGFDLPSGTFSVSRSGGEVTVAGDVRWAVPKLATVRFTGTFTRTGIYGMSYNLRGDGAISPGQFDFGSGGFRIWRKVGVSEGGVVAYAEMAIPGFAAGTASLKVLSTTELAFSVKLAMEGTIGDVLGNPTATVNFFDRPHPWLPERYARLKVDVVATGALGLPLDVTVKGNISSAHGFNWTATAALNKSGGATIYDPVFGWYICAAKYKLWGNSTTSIVGTADSLAIATTFDLGAWGKCGVISGGVGVEGSLTYSSPSSFSGQVKVAVDYGAGTWRPTVFSFSS